MKKEGVGVRGDDDDDDDEDDDDDDDGDERVAERCFDKGWNVLTGEP